MTDASVNRDRLWASLMQLAKIGATPAGGVCRLALSDEDLRARDMFAGWCRDAGLSVRVDELGNIFARRAGSNPDAEPVLSGSHLDSQPLGGRFDGAYGVMAALEMVRAMNDADITTRRPVDIVAWTNEEGSRFPAGCMGSSVFAGRRDMSAMLDMEDDACKSVKAELARIGYNGAEPCGFPLSALFEVHIEQGPVLERSDTTIGIVKGAQGLRCYQVYVTGTEGHAGTLPMDQRRDAGQGAARMIVAIDELAQSFRPQPVMTVGVVSIGPGSRNTIPGSAMFTIDCRCPEEAGLEKLERAIHKICDTIAADRNLDVKVDCVTTIPPVVFDPDCIDAVRAAAKQTGAVYCDILSGAGHDACHISTVAPVGMIFIPCKDGISHNEVEYASPEDVAAGCQVLLNAVVDYANR